MMPKESDVAGIHEIFPSSKGQGPIESNVPESSHARKLGGKKRGQEKENKMEAFKIRWRTRTSSLKETKYRLHQSTTTPAETWGMWHPNNLQKASVRGSKSKVKSTISSKASGSGNHTNITDHFLSGSNRKKRVNYLKRIRLRSFPPWGKETKVISTPGSTWATHSLGSSSSMKTTDSVRPLTDAGVVSPLERTFSLPSISLPHNLGVALPALR